MITNLGGGGGAVAPLTLTGLTDVTELTLAMFSGQGSAPFKVLNSGSANIFQVDNAGSLTLAGGAGTGNINMGGSLDISNAGQGIKVKEGTNAKQGLTAAMSAGVVVTANTAVTANSRILFAQQSGTLTGVVTCTRTAGTSFTLTSSVSTDTAAFAYQIFEPG